MEAFVHLCLPVLLILHLHGASSHTLCSQCDCTVSNPDKDDRAIISIKPLCEQGQVTWLDAYGAIRMELAPTISGDFRYCIRIHSDNVNTVVSQEVTSRVPGNYRLKILDSATVKLSPLLTTRGTGKEYCISGSGPVHLYFETERSVEDIGVARVKVHYDVERISSNLRYSPMEECRPCTDRELLRAYCSSDFVAVGTMDDVTHYEDTSQIRVSVSQLVSQKEIIFRKSEDGWSRPHELKGFVHVPLRCGIRYGEGQFMFTGRVRLGQPVLQCAPRYEQWKEVMEKAVADDMLECSYG